MPDEMRPCDLPLPPDPIYIRTNGGTVRPMKAVQMFAQVANTLSISQLHQLAYLLHDDLDNHGHEMTAEQIEAHRRALRAMRAEIDLLSH